MYHPSVCRKKELCTDENLFFTKYMKFYFSLNIIWLASWESISFLSSQSVKVANKIYSLTQCSLNVNECHWHILVGNNGVFPKCFQWICWIQWQKIFIAGKGFEPQSPLVFETSMLPKRQPDTCDLNSAQFMLQWFIWFPEFAEFSESFSHSGKTLMRELNHDVVVSRCDWGHGIL